MSKARPTDPSGLSSSRSIAAPKRSPNLSASRFTRTARGENFDDIHRSQIREGLSRLQTAHPLDGLDGRWRSASCCSLILLTAEEIFNVLDGLAAGTPSRLPVDWPPVSSMGVVPSVDLLSLTASSAVSSSLSLFASSAFACCCSTRHLLMRPIQVSLWATC